MEHVLNNRFCLLSYLQALTISICVSFFFILLPFSFRWIAIAIVGGGGLFENSPVILGYMMTLSIPFAYLGIFLTLRQISFPAIVRWFSLGYHFITKKLSCLLSKNLVSCQLFRD